MKALLIIAFFLGSLASARAAHIIGGEMTYEYVSTNADGTKKYRITLRLFRDEACAAPCAGMPSNVYIGVFNNDNFQQVHSGGAQPYYDVPRQSEGPIGVDALPPCITRAPTLDYHVASYVVTVNLPENKKGYTASYQTCCRVNGLANVDNGNGRNAGSTYNCIIPGTDNLAWTENNNSPQFKLGISVICQNKKFMLNFNATDAVGDSLVYYFCDAYDGGNTQNSGNVNPMPPSSATPLQYGSVPYTNGYTSSAPMGPNVVIDPKTGLISGVAPGIGKYVICVCIKEYRKGVLIGYHRKDFIINVSDCDFAAASLLPVYATCDGFSYSFKNESPPTPLVHSYYWEFGDGQTSTEATPTHTYADSGTYKLKLVINKGEECTDSTTSIIKVYPGFTPDFSYVPCKNDPTQFNDQTRSVYGVVDSWSWDFGDQNSTSDVSRLQNPTYTYPQPGKKTVTLIVTNSKGCLDTISKEIDIVSKATVSPDTVVVVGQQLQLLATGGDVYSWSPSTDLNDPNRPDPIAVYDGSYDSIRYRVDVTTVEGCQDSAFVKVRIFNTKPQVFVPTGFTPNADGKNDVVRPVAAGIKKMEFFRIYNRWGQLVFSTTQSGKGWDGRINGKLQGTNVYVWIVKAIDYTDKTFFAKGTVTLIR